MVKVFFDDVDLSEYELVLEDYAVGSPSLNVSKVSILGRNGQLDYSNAITGFPSFSNRTVSLRLGAFVGGLDRDRIFTQVVNKFFGKTIKIAFSNLEGYFVGVVNSVTKKTDVLHLAITMSIDCNPFRVTKKLSKVIILSTIEQIVELDEINQPTNPTITTTGNTTLIVDNTIYSFGEGSRSLGQLVRSNSSIKCTGIGTLTIEYNVEVI